MTELTVDYSLDPTQTMDVVTTDHHKHRVLVQHLARSRLLRAFVEDHLADPYAGTEVPVDCPSAVMVQLIRYWTMGPPDGRVTSDTNLPLKLQCYSAEDRAFAHHLRLHGGTCEGMPVSTRLMVFLLRGDVCFTSTRVGHNEYQDVGQDHLLNVLTAQLSWLMSEKTVDDVMPLLGTVRVSAGYLRSAGKHRDSRPTGDGSDEEKHTLTSDEDDTDKDMDTHVVPLARRTRPPVVPKSTKPKRPGLARPLRHQPYLGPSPSASVSTSTRTKPQKSLTRSNAPSRRAPPPM